MEAGSETTTLKGKNSLQSREIFLFLLFIVLSHNKFQTSNPDLISFLQKGILIPVLSGFMFLFLLLYRPVSTQPVSTFSLKVLKYIYPVFSAISYKVENELRNRIQITILYNLNAAPRHSCLKEIPGLISSEAPSSRLDFLGFIASLHIC